MYPLLRGSSSRVPNRRSKVGFVHIQTHDAGEIHLPRLDVRQIACFSLALNAKPIGSRQLPTAKGASR